MTGGYQCEVESGTHLFICSFIHSPNLCEAQDAELGIGEKDTEADQQIRQGPSPAELRVWWGQRDKVTNGSSVDVSAGQVESSGVGLPGFESGPCPLGKMLCLSFLICKVDTVVPSQERMGGLNGKCIAECLIIVSAQ